MAKKARNAEPASEPEDISTGNTGLDAEMKLLEKKRKAGAFKDLIDQVNAEYELSWAYMKPKFDEWNLRLKLYNNQKREKDAIGDPLLFTVHQTLLASLYGDRLQAKFLGRESGDEEVGESLDALASFDYDEMGKDELDYDWDWDTLFFGRGLMLMFEYDRKMKLPIPERVDPMTFLRDPRARSVNGDLRGRNALRFFGRPIRLTKAEMEDAGVYFNFGGLKADAFDLKNPLDMATQARDEASGHNNATNSLRSLKGENADHMVLEWWTRWNGKRVIVGLGDNRRKIVRYTELDEEAWPLVDRALFPTASDWDGVSVPDIVEDKQRARAVLANLSLKGAKSNVHPMYLYDTNKIKNRADLNFGFNKFIGVDGTPSAAIMTMPKDVVKQEVQYIMDMLDTSAQKALATPDIQAGQVTEQKRTLGELQLVDKNVDTRYSLAAKIFGWSEKRFWRMWHARYKKHFHDGIDDKQIRLAGAFGPKWKTLKRENIIGAQDPDIKIESKVLADAQRFNDLRSFQAVLQTVAQDPNANLRYGEKRFAKLSGMRKDEIDQLLPPTVEELRAEEENAILDADELVQVGATDDHIIHMEIHNKAADGPAKTAHIKAHKMAMVLQRTRPDLFQGLPPSAANPRAGAGMDTEMLGRPTLTPGQRAQGAREGGV